MPEPTPTPTPPLQDRELHPIGTLLQSASILLLWPAFFALIGTLVFFPQGAHAAAYTSGSWLWVLASAFVALEALLIGGLALVQSRETRR